MIPSRILSHLVCHAYAWLCASCRMRINHIKRNVRQKEPIEDCRPKIEYRRGSQTETRDRGCRSWSYQSRMISAEDPAAHMRTIPGTAQEAGYTSYNERSSLEASSYCLVRETCQAWLTFPHCTHHSRVIRCWVTDGTRQATQIRVHAYSRSRLLKVRPRPEPSKHIKCSSQFGTAVWCPALGVVSTLPDVVFTLSIPSFSVSSATLASRAPS